MLDFPIGFVNGSFIWNITEPHWHFPRNKYLFIYFLKVYLNGVTQDGKGSSEGKKVQQILTSKYVMGILNWFKIVKNKKIHEAILEIAVNTHSPFCPKLVDYSACVPPALQNGFVNSFDFDNFESHKHPYTQFWSQTLLDLFPLWVTLATLGDCKGKDYNAHIFIRFTFMFTFCVLYDWIRLFRTWFFVKVKQCFLWKIIKKGKNGKIWLNWISHFLSPISR